MSLNLLIFKKPINKKDTFLLKLLLSILHTNTQLLTQNEIQSSQHNSHDLLNELEQRQKLEKIQLVGTKPKVGVLSSLSQKTKTREGIAANTITQTSETRANLCQSISNASSTIDKKSHWDGVSKFHLYSTATRIGQCK